MKIGEIREKESAELEKEHETLRRELWTLSHKSQTEPIDRPNRLGDIRRTIARILTVLEERKRSAKETA